MELQDAKFQCAELFFFFMGPNRKLIAETEYSVYIFFFIRKKVKTQINSVNNSI